jgi:hypothetical protein
MENIISIESVASAYTNRARALQAIENLLPRLKSGPVLLRFDINELVSLSFIDELILRLTDADQLSSVIFVTERPHVLEKLAQIAAIRNAIIHYAVTPEAPPRVLEPRQTAPIIVHHRSESRGMPGSKLNPPRDQAGRFQESQPGQGRDFRHRRKVK